MMVIIFIEYRFSLYRENAQIVKMPNDQDPCVETGSSGFAAHWPNQARLQGTTTCTHDLPACIHCAKVFSPGVCAA